MAKNCLKEIADSPSKSFLLYDILDSIFDLGGTLSLKCKLYYYLWKAADADTKMARAITDLMSALGSRSGSRMRSLRWTNKRDFYILHYLALDRILKIKMTQRACSLDQLKKLAWKFFKIIKDKSTLSLFLENMFTKNNDIEKCTFLCRFFIWKIWVWRTNLLQSILYKEWASYIAWQHGILSNLA